MAFCTYCGVPNPETSDHIPPKTIFAKPYPPNLLTVPCCTKCNNNMSKDDEYFRNMLAFRMDLKENSDVQSLLPKVLRSLGRPEHGKFTKYLIDSSLIEQIRLEDGSYTDIGIHTSAN